MSAPARGTVEDYKTLQRQLGLERVVVVQPSAYEIDNAVTMAAIAEFGLSRARGVAVWSMTGWARRNWSG